MSFLKKSWFDKGTSTKTPLNASGLNDLEQRILDAFNNIDRNSAGSHNSIFRGKDITSYLDDESLYTRISNGAFDDLYIGDYIKKNGITWRIAAFDYYLNRRTSLHHAIFVPDESLGENSMNETATTSKGYSGSNMFSTILPGILTELINPIFDGHVMSYSNLLTTATNETGYNRWGTNSGCASSWDFKNQNLSLMNEVQVTGTIAWSSSGFDIGIDNVQFPLFKMAPEFISLKDKNYWTRAVSTKNRFTIISLGGYNNSEDANLKNGIRPYFIIH